MYASRCGPPKSPTTIPMIIPSIVPLLLPKLLPMKDPAIQQKSVKTVVNNKR